MDSSALDERRLHAYSSSELMTFVQQAPPHPDDLGQSIRVLSINLVAKACFNERAALDEKSALELASRLGIRVPSVLRVVADHGIGSQHWIIMDRIHGNSLHHIWRSLGWRRTITIAWQLRQFVRLMRSQTSTVAGGIYSGITNSVFFNDFFGPKKHASPKDFSGYLTWWLTALPPNIRTARRDLAAAISLSKPHVFTHHDIAPRNLILDERNRVWLVDWGHSGYLPVYMEYVGMEPLKEPWCHGTTWADRMARWRWSVLRWIVVGSFPKERDAIEAVNERSRSFAAWRGPYSRERKEVEAD